MKNCGKKLLSLALAAVMSSCMISAFANTVEITKVEVLSNASDTTGTEFTKSENGFENVSLTPNQLLRVTVQLKGADNANTSGEISFLSNAKDAQTLNNENIQYVDQQTASDGTATITFRPRLSTGTFVAKAGGTDVSEAKGFEYAVENPVVEMTLDKAAVSITEGGTAEFTITNESKPDSVTVKEGTTDVANITYDKTSGKISVSNLSVGNHTLIISAAGFAEKSVTVEVTAKQEITDDEKQQITEDLNNQFNTIDGGAVSATVSLPKTSKNKNLTYTIKGDATLSAEGVLSINDNKFAAKVEVSAKVGNVAVAENKVIYLVANPDTLISYGNMDLKSSTDGSDAFATTDKLNGLDLTEADKVSLKAQGLNHVLRNTTPVKAIQSSLDYDMDGTITLSEYRMFKLMLEGSTDFTPEKLNDATVRNSWINQAKAASQTGE